MKKFLSLSIVALFICLQSVYPQITTKELPISIQRGIGVFAKSKEKGIVNLPAPDIQKILREDSVYIEKNPNIQITSISIPLIIESNKNGVWTTLEDGGKLWQMGIHVDKAYALDFVFSKFWLPKTGKFYIFNPKTNETIGAITSQYLSGEKTNPRRFSTGIVNGDDIVLEYYQPFGEEDLPIIEVEKAYDTFIPPPNFLSPSTASCEVDVNCSEGYGWQSEKKAVAMIYCKFGYLGFWGSGSLLNNTQNNHSPLFLTANHLLQLEWVNGTIIMKDAISDNDLSDWVFYWGYELSNCSDTIQPEYKTTVGAVLKANNADTDFALFQLQQDPLNIPGYIPYYLGWDASGNSGTGGVCIHHPNHDVKKISTYSCTPTTVSYNSSPYVNWAVSWLGTANGHGITETASSGAPLINSSHRVIGQLRGASDILSCSNYTGTSKFGKVSDSWTGYGNNDYRRRLDYWLDPYGTNTQIIDGLSPYNMSGPSLICGSSTGTFHINNLPSFYTVNWGIDNNDFTITPSGNQCFVSYIGSQGYGIANLTASVYYNSSLLKQFTKTIKVGIPPFDVTITGGDGSHVHWTSNMVGNSADVEELFDIPFYYSQFEANLYRMSADFDPYDTLINHWSSFSLTHLPISNTLYPGWYLLQVRGTNDCGTSDWEEVEIECVDTEMLRANGEEMELSLIYNRQSQILTVTSNRAAQSRSTTNDTYTLQLWNEMNLVRESKQDDPVVQIPMTGLKSGLYTIRYVNKDKVIAKKFLKY